MATAKAVRKFAGRIHTVVKWPEPVLAKRGDEVTVFGAGDDGEPTAEEWARWAGTIGDEIVARMRRLPRIYR